MKIIKKLMSVLFDETNESKNKAGIDISEPIVSQSFEDTYDNSNPVGDVENSQNEMYTILNTDAPKSWPTVKINDAYLNNPGADPSFLIGFCARFSEAFNLEGGKGLAVCNTILTPKGLIDMPVTFKHNNKTFVLFPYNSNNFSGKFKYSRKKVKEVLGLESYYYSAQKFIKSAEEESSERKFSIITAIRRTKDAESGTFAMWWASSNDDNYIGSNTQKLILKLYETLDRIETYAFCLIGHSLGLCDEKDTRLKLPEEEISLFVNGPDMKTFIVTVSEEKGISFRFNTETTSVQYRDNLLKHMLAYFEELRCAIINAKAPFDEYSNSSPLLWYKFFEKINEKQEKGNKVAVLGATIINHKNNN